MSRTELLAEGKKLMRQARTSPQHRRLAIAYADSVLDLDLHPSPLAQRRERRLRRLLLRSLDNSRQLEGGGE